MGDDINDTMRDGEVGTDAVETATTEAAWAEYLSPLCETCRAAVDAYDPALSPEQVASFWSALDNEETEGRYGQCFLTSNRVNDHWSCRGL